MTYSHEVEHMCVVKKGPNHGPAPIPEGRSAGVATSTAFFLKAVSTTLNLSFDIIPDLICC